MRFFERKEHSIYSRAQVGLATRPVVQIALLYADHADLEVHLASPLRYRQSGCPIHMVSHHDTDTLTLHKLREALQGVLEYLDAESRAAGFCNSAIEALAIVNSVSQRQDTVADFTK